MYFLDEKLTKKDIIVIQNHYLNFDIFVSDVIVSLLLNQKLLTFYKFVIKLIMTYNELFYIGSVSDSFKAVEQLVKEKNICYT
jgi:hypothetical protein